MEISEFKQKKNRQNPKLCYSFVKVDKDKRYTIFTMNSGKSFLAFIEELYADGTWRTMDTHNCTTINECLNVFETSLTTQG